MSDGDQLNLDGACPIPRSRHTTIQLAHGSGGRLTYELIRSLFLQQFGNELLQPLEDQARPLIGGSRLAFTTDSFVVDPIFFPGGNIGDLAVNGTVNDICMSGAKPLFLSVGLIIEEGLPMADLQTIVESMAKAASECGVAIITGDTKVVDKGKADKIFVNTSGIGVIEHDFTIGADQLREGDLILVNASLANHGMAIMSQRQELGFETEICSDTASLQPLVAGLIADCGDGVRALRDATRGGLAAVLNEFAEASNVSIQIDETAIPIRPSVAAACELLGFDPLLVANEGVMIIAVAPDCTADALASLHKHDLGKDANVIARVSAIGSARVTLKTRFGTERIVDLPVGEQLPRICLVNRIK